LQKCSISSTPSLLSKIKVKSPEIQSSLQKQTNPVEAINNKIKSDEIGRLFAVVQLCGKQFKITSGDVILVEGYWEPKNGDQLRLDKVMSSILNTGTNFLIIY
jgi:large subunit ribosomal protein L21